tara:strand:+ start:162 stop:428 length:267 start_codon:yes stop_codon:yes gene_type:complete
MKKNKLPKWFDGELYSEGDIVTNSFSGEKYELDAEQLSMYDFIMGCQYIIEMQGGPFSESSTDIQNDMRKGLDWFRKNDEKAYKVLLD